MQGRLQSAIGIILKKANGDKEFRVLKVAPIEASQRRPKGGDAAGKRAPLLN